MHPFPRVLSATLVVAGLIGTTTPSATGQEPVAVVASIKPLHSLVANVMADLGEPGLILSGGDSEHAYSLKPSGAAALQDADVVFWIGEGLESFLVDTIPSLADDAQAVALGETAGLLRLPLRTGATWEAHDHAHESGHHHPAEDDRHGGFDPHLWLDPGNARGLVTTIADTLVEADPANADIYRANAEATAARLEALDTELAALLAPVAGRPFVVFHDGYQYLESHYGLSGVGAITLSPEVQPGASRLQEIRDLIAALGAVCVFTEPQFTPTLVATVTEGTSARIGMLDTLGAGLPEGPDLYFQLMRANAQALVDCLGD